MCGVPETLAVYPLQDGRGATGLGLSTSQHLNGNHESRLSCTWQAIQPVPAAKRSAETAFAGPIIYVRMPTSS